MPAIPGGLRPRPTSRIRQFVVFGLLIAAGSLAMPARPAQAQSVLVLVNHRPITSFDVDQRIRLAALTERRRIDRKIALNELIDDLIKIQEVQRIGYRVTDAGVDDEFSRLAKSNRQTPQEFEANLRRAGIEPSSLKTKMRAEIAWTTLLRDQNRRGTSVTNEDVERAFEDAKKKAKPIMDYRLRSIIFVVPNPATAGERQRAAQAARAKFTSCETGFAELQAMRDVAVRDEIVKSSDTLSPQLMALLEKTPVNRLTAPALSEQGIEMVAVCARTERAGSGTMRLTVENELASKQLDKQGKELLDKIRKKALIEHRR